MAGETAHLIFVMGQLLVISGNIAPGSIVNANGLGVSRFLAVIPLARGDGVNGLLDAPPAARLNHRVLNDVSTLQINVITVLVLLLAVARHALKQRNACAAFVVHADAGQVAPFRLIELAVN